jgi:hypothetical protein
LQGPLPELVEVVLEDVPELEPLAPLAVLVM